MTSLEAPVELVPYDPSWPEQFLKESAILLPALATWLVGAIEHIGSTAVPGLAAKPVIDIMAGVRTLDESRPAIRHSPSGPIIFTSSRWARRSGFGRLPFATTSVLTRRWPLNTKRSNGG
jgi:hypothetical protein